MWKKPEYNNIIKFGAISFLLWSFISVFRLFPLNYEFVYAIIIISIIYIIVESLVLSRLNHYLIWIGVLITYTIFTAFFFYTSRTIFLFISYLSFGFLFPKLCEIRGDKSVKKEQAGFDAASVAFGFGLSVLGVYCGVALDPFYSMLLLFIGAFLGSIIFIHQRNIELVVIAQKVGKKKNSLLIFLSILAIGEVFFLCITIFMNPSVLCYYTGINYNYLLIYVLISFAIAGIFGISFREIISYFKNKIYLLFIFFNALGLTGFVLMLFVQG
ncbi:MAG TPA: hypothetical protein VMV49_16560, partial [Candidatus Deferrimicrobium sp.]|nr:hypothetical protein [Candidatus Deferrimicrobium sp.]